MPDDVSHCSPQRVLDWMIWIWPANARNIWRPLTWLIWRVLEVYNNSQMILDGLWKKNMKHVFYKLIEHDLKLIIFRKFRATPIWGSLHDDVCRFCSMTVPCGISISHWITLAYWFRFAFTNDDSNPGGSSSWTSLNLTISDMLARCSIKCRLNETCMSWCLHLQNMSWSVASF